MEELKAFIKSKIDLPDSDLEVITGAFRELRLPKGKSLVRQGQVVTDYFFVVSGAVRIYFNTGDKEITGWVAFENAFFTELTSLKRKLPTRFTLEAIEDTTLLVLSGKDMDRFYEYYPLWQQFGRQLWEDAFLRVVDGILSFQLYTAEERYQIALEQSELLQRVPLKDVSSLLGITPNSLSRIRKNTR